MKRRRTLITWTGIVLLWIAFAGFVWFTASQLPDRVATHFGASGQPNGWMTRSGHVQFTLIMGLVVPAFAIGCFAVIRCFRGQGLNIPHKSYWLAPERREETFEYIQRQGFWLAGSMIVFFAAIHYSILLANRRTPVALSPIEAGWIAGVFGAATLVWAVIFVVHFYRKPV